ncbi:MAG: Rieske (2Fe-2S) protein [Candidatus Eiseniibacteriota bacterium]
MSEFVRVAKVSDLDEGKGAIVWVNGTKVALFRRDGVFYAIRNQCPHMGGDLGEGYLQGDIVRCPEHGWRFSIKTGKAPDTEVVGVRTYEVKVEGEEVFVRG